MKSSASTAKDERSRAMLSASCERRVVVRPQEAFWPAQACKRGRARKERFVWMRDGSPSIPYDRAAIAAGRRRLITRDSTTDASMMKEK